MPDTVTTTEAAPATDSFTGGSVDYSFLQEGSPETTPTETTTPDAPETAKAEAPSFDISSLPADIQAKLTAYDGYAPVIEKLGKEGITDATAFDQRIQAQQQKAQEAEQMALLQQEVWGPIYQRQLNGELTPEQAAAQYNHEVRIAEQQFTIQSELAALKEQKMGLELDRAAAEFTMYKRALDHKETGTDAKDLALFISREMNVPVVESVAFINRLIETVVKMENADAIAKHEKSKQAQTPLPSGNSVTVGNTPRQGGNVFDRLVQKSRDI
jgi:hypothetical protein